MINSYWTESAAQTPASKREDAQKVGRSDRGMWMTYMQWLVLTLERARVLGGDANERCRVNVDRWVAVSPRISTMCSYFAALYGRPPPSSS
jgi:hypothetical protein